MAKQRCPICNGKVYLEYCEDCGYRVPNEETISSQYNYDPTDYPVPDIEEIKSPEIQSPPEYVPLSYEPHKSKDDIPDISDLQPAPKIEVISSDETEINPYAQKLKDFTPYDNGGWQKSSASNASNQRQKDIDTGIYKTPSNQSSSQNQNNENPYANKNFTPYNNSSYGSDEGSFGQFIKDEWFKLIFIFIGSFMGIIWCVILGNLYKSKSEPKYTNYRKYLSTILIIRVILMIFIHF